MPRRLAIALLTLLLAAPAAAQEQRTGGAAPPALRGSPSAAHARRPTPPPDADAGVALSPFQSTPLAGSPLISAAAGGTAQCPMSCARSYYFCLAGDDGETCSPAWAQCRAGCAPPPTAPRLASAWR